MLRSLTFQAVYWIVSIFFALGAIPLMLAPGRRAVVAWIALYARVMRLAMRVVAGVRVEIKGREHLPEGPFIIAAKHQSWGDGFIYLSEFGDLAFVTGDHLERFPLVGGILRKLGAIIVDNCGGAAARARLVDDEMRAAAAEGRRILIFPEGHLAPVGRRYRYKRGVYHLYTAYQAPCVPAATNLGLYWPQQSFRLRPGVATIEFLPALPVGLEKTEFMMRLEEAVESRALALLGDARPADASLATPPLMDPAAPERRKATA
ncbi:MAG: 1-acyl-sn-glycerol-3-phosphate acyltransferase [Parvularculaceae bacterium]|nr:1-acyl-sn-glycerol-3-phosphate acyltransferase [Parvularculaceae bacterium]